MEDRKSVYAFFPDKWYARIAFVTYVMKFKLTHLKIGLLGCIKRYFSSQLQLVMMCQQHYTILNGGNILYSS